MAISCNNAAAAYIQHSTASGGSIPQSYSMWFRVPNTADNFTLLNNANNVSCNANGAASDKLIVQDDVGNVVTSSNAFSASTWHHLGLTVNSSSEASVFLDGTKTTGSAGGGTMGASITNRWGNTSTAADVEVAECAFWNAQLTDAEMTILSRGISAALVRPASLFHYLPAIRNVRDTRRSTTITFSGGAVVEHPRIYYGRNRHTYFAAPPNEIITSVAQTLSLSQSAALSELERSASNSLLFSYSTYPPFVEVGAANTLALVQERQYNNNAESALALAQQAYSPEVLRSVEQTFRMRQLVRAVAGNIASGRYRR